MSHHSDENMLIASSDSFWEPGNYKRTTKRIEDGYRLCNDLIALIQERADIEKAYAKSLKGWNKKWNELIEKGPEYGTTEAAWKGVLVEADRLCDLHVRVRDELCNDVIQTVKQWQKDTYHKTVLHIKERKEMEDAFKRAQKPWCKLLTKVNKTKNDYHVACKSERSAANQERNAAADSSLSMDQLKKMQDRVQKAKEEVTRAREKYELALAELSQHTPKYMEDMGLVFERCQDMETTRLLFFKDTLFSIHKRLNISQDPILPQIYEEFHHTINNADHEKDLKWWSNNHGVNMAMNWPQFEEYTEEFRDISKGKVKEALPAGTITLINQRPVGEDLHDLPSVNSKSLAKKPAALNHNSHRITVSDITLPAAHHEGAAKPKPPSPGKETKKGAELISHKPQTITNGGTNGRPVGGGGGGTPTGTAHLNGSSPGGGGGGESNPFDEEEWDEEGGEEGGGGELVDTGEPGVPVRALYDYEGAENDELSFKQGELFEKLEDEDEQGWCKGRKDGRVGLYPANYVEPVP